MLFTRWRPRFICIGGQRDTAASPRLTRDEQTAYIKLSELHTFKNYPFQVRNDEKMKAMISSVRDKGVGCGPARYCSPHVGMAARRSCWATAARRPASLRDSRICPCIVRDRTGVTGERAITQMVEDNTKRRENILSSERAKTLKL